MKSVKGLIKKVFKNNLETDSCNSHNLSARFPFRYAPLQSGLAPWVFYLSQPFKKLLSFNQLKYLIEAIII